MKTIRELIYKRGFGKVNGRRVPITDNKIIEEKLGKIRKHWFEGAHIVPGIFNRVVQSLPLIYFLSFFKIIFNRSVCVIQANTTLSAWKIWSTKFTPLDRISSKRRISCGRSSWTHLLEAGEKRPTTSLKAVISAIEKIRSTFCCEKWFKFCDLFTWSSLTVD